MKFRPHSLVVFNEEEIRAIKTDPRQKLIVFLKYPEPGKVKTRLAQYIGKEKAAHIYSVIAEAIIHHVSKSREYKTIIFFDPPERKSDVENWLLNNDCKFLTQEGNSLGERMANAFSKTFSLGAEKAVIIGTDCTDISNDLISEAFATLDITDVVLGPAQDGGYYLLGLKKRIPEIFNNIDWSTDRVLNQTLKTLREKGLRFQLLQTLKDVDTANDLNDELLFKIRERINDQ